MLDVAAVANGMLDMNAAFLGDSRHPNRFRRRPVDTEDDKAMSGLLHVIQDVIHRGGQRMDVLAVKRSDEAAVQCLNDSADDLVASMLLEFDFLATRREAVESSHH